MVKHTQTIRRQLPTNCLKVFNHFVGLVLTGLTEMVSHSVSYVLQQAFTQGKWLIREVGIWKCSEKC